MNHCKQHRSQTGTTMKMNYCAEEPPPSKLKNHRYKNKKLFRTPPTHGGERIVAKENGR